MLTYDGVCDRCPRPRSGHNRQRITVGLDRHITVVCECGQSWDLGEVDMVEGQTVAMRHALNPNVGDPRKDPKAQRKRGAKGREQARSEVVAAWLAKARQRPPG